MLSTKCSDKFINLLNASLGASLQRAIEVKMVSKEIVKFGESPASRLPTPPDSVFTPWSRLIGSAMLAVEPSLVLSLIDCMFSRRRQTVGKTT